MAQKFIGLDDAADQLGVAKERLNELREAGKLRAYRDGASWKFRSDEIDELGKTGLPSVGDDSSIGMPIDEDDAGSLELESAETASPAEPAKSDEGLELGDLSIADDVGDSLELAPASDVGGAAASDLDLASIDEPTVAAEEPASTGDDDLVLDTEASGDDAESILLSEAELGDASNRPPSTIIGKNELEGSDLQLAPSDSDAAAMSDVRLADDDTVLPGDSGDSLITSSPSAAGKFEDLAELEIDLEAESSRILEAGDVAAAQAAGKAQAGSGSGAKAAGESDLSLAPSDSAPGLAALSDVDPKEDKPASEAGLTGISSLDMDKGGSSGAGLSGLSSIELADDAEDDFVLGDSGSDITLSGGESGINLMPSDSGISLEDASQILGGSAVGSSLDLGEIDAGGSNVGSQAMASDLASSEDFLLTPIGDDEGEDEADSSQVIALEAVEEDVPGEEEVMIADAGAMDLGEMQAAMAPTTSAAPLVAEATFPLWIMMLLGSCLTIMLVCGVMMVDVVRCMWSWNEPTSLNSSLIDGLLGIFGR